MSSPIREGEVLAGKYRVDKVLGVGGMGVVVAARHIELDDRVAIKFMLPEALANAEAVARFAREARAAVKIKSEHVARVSDVGKLDNGAPYMVMEYLEGSDLSAWLSQRGALPIEQAIEFILQASEAIAEAHALGIVHRDLKPANLFVIRRADGGLSVKVLDFGISKMTGAGGSSGNASMTKTSALMGSPLYMSPEQMQSSKDVDARGDIWALGVILYELITGVGPFTGESMPELILQVMSAAPPPLRNKRPDAPEGLEAVILRCLNKDRGRRFETVGELAVALLPFAPKRSKVSVERISGVMKAAGYSATALVMPPSSDPAEQMKDAGTAASWGRTTTKKGRGPWMLVGGIGALIVVVGGAAAMRKPSTSGEVGSSFAPVSPAAPVLAASEVQAPSGTTRAPAPSNSAEPSQPPSSPPLSTIPVNPPSGTAPSLVTGPIKNAPIAKRDKPPRAATSAGPPPPTVTPAVVSPVPAAAQPRLSPPPAVPPPKPPKPPNPTDPWGAGRH